MNHHTEFVKSLRTPGYPWDKIDEAMSTTLQTGKTTVGALISRGLGVHVDGLKKAVYEYELHETVQLPFTTWYMSDKIPEFDFMEQLFGTIESLRRSLDNNFYHKLNEVCPCFEMSLNDKKKQLNQKGYHDLIVFESTNTIITKAGCQIIIGQEPYCYHEPKRNRFVLTTIAVPVFKKDIRGNYGVA